MRAADSVGALALATEVVEAKVTLSEPVEMHNKEHRTTLPKEVVRRVQERLKALDLYKGSLDGSYGSGMQKALGAFQKQNKLTETGIADQQTLVRLMYQPGRQ